MKVVECYDVESILREAEATFQIDGKDYEETDINYVLQVIRSRISRQSQVDLTNKKVTDPDMMTGVYRAQVVMLTNSMALLHSKLCGWAQIERYLAKAYTSMSAINYMGYTEESMRTFLKALQMKATAPKAGDAMQAIKDKLSSIGMCREKRLFLVMIVADAIGYKEIVAAIAEILYQGMF